MTLALRFGLSAWAAVGLGLLAGTAAQAQLRVATWNVTNYDGGRTEGIRTAVYGMYQGRWLAPDIIVCQEFISSAAVSAFRSALNTAPGSPGDWAAATFVNGPDTDNAFFYRTSKVSYLGHAIASYGGSPPDPPRDALRYDVRLNGYTSDGAVLSCYSTHMKNGSTAEDYARRLLEAQRIRDNAETLDPDWHFLLAGDLNIYRSGEQAYQELVGGQPNNAGRFFDPINTPGIWNNRAEYRFVHTQDPVGPGGMDDRFDQILLSLDLIDGDGFEYIGQPLTPYSTTTWNDPNHSYRAWGNDGTSFNTKLTITGNQMVGAAIAQALVNVAHGAGHLPVFLHLRVPPRVDSDELLDFGQVPQGTTAEEVLTVWNDGDVALWNAEGIADLSYSLAATTGFTAPGATFVDPAGGAKNQHVITMGTSTVGVKNGTVTIASNAPDQPIRLVTLVGEVIPSGGLTGDLNCDGKVDFDDIDPFVLALGGQAGYYAQYPTCRWLNGDINGDGTVDFDDIDPFVALLGG